MNKNFPYLLNIVCKRPLWLLVNTYYHELTQWIYLLQKLIKNFLSAFFFVTKTLSISYFGTHNYKKKNAKHSWTGKIARNAGWSIVMQRISNKNWYEIWSVFNKELNRNFLGLNAIFSLTIKVPTLWEKITLTNSKIRQRHTLRKGYQI